MTTLIAAGTTVTLRSSQGKIIRVVVEDLGEIVRVCRAEELQKAHAEGREPVTVGFPKDEILE